MSPKDRKNLRNALEKARRAVLCEGIGIGADTEAHVEFWLNINLWSAGALESAQARHDKRTAIVAFGGAA